jgi:DNA-directed RNA polymerase subunit RPC12/RpoP
MKSHHLLIEVHQRSYCPYCRNKLSGNEWYSDFDLTHHYKGTECDKCGRKIHLKVGFNGSGHDCWDQNSKFCKFVGPAITIKPLEEKIKEK